MEYQSPQPTENTMITTSTDVIRHAESSLPAGTWGFVVIP